VCFVLKIKQSYHGNGGKEGYRFLLYNNDIELCSIKNVPVEVYYGATLEIGGSIYYVDKIYDCEKSPEEDEVIWYELEPYEVDFKLEIIP
jgi:hypothetical protein